MTRFQKWLHRKVAQYSGQTLTPAMKAQRQLELELEDERERLLARLGLVKYINHPHPPLPAGQEHLLLVPVCMALAARVEMLEHQLRNGRRLERNTVLPTSWYHNKE